MPMKCCVPGCTSNYNGTEGYVKIFSVPNNPVRRQAWIENIPRENWTPTKSSFVCIKHFKEEDIVMGKQRWKLTPVAVPTIFPDAPHKSSKRNHYVRKQFRAPVQRGGNASDALQNDYNQQIPESVGDFGGIENRLDVVYCEVEDGVQIKEEPSNTDGSTIDNLDYQKSEVPTSCGDDDKIYTVNHLDYRNSEDPTNCRDFANDDKRYTADNSEDPITSCGDSAYGKMRYTMKYTPASEIDSYRFEILGKYWTGKMKSLENEQRIFAEKLINDVLFEAELGRLSHECYLTNQ